MASGNSNGPHARNAWAERADHNIALRSIDSEYMFVYRPVEGDGADRLPGWFFRVSERSAGVVCAEGTDLWGGHVSVVGTDEEETLTRCVAAAASVAED